MFGWSKAFIRCFGMTTFEPTTMTYLRRTALKSTPYHSVERSERFLHSTNCPRVLITDDDICFGNTKPKIAFIVKKVRRMQPLFVIEDNGGCSLGQLGFGLASYMRSQYGRDNVIMSDISRPTQRVLQSGPYLFADVLDVTSLRAVVVNYEIDCLVHFSALLSAVGERDVPWAMKVNIEGVHNVLEIARAYDLKLFIPSTIGAFGPDTPRNPTPDLTIQRPRTIYGVSKVHAELMGEYYHHRFGIDFRSLRYPGVISSDTMPGGGTTDYALMMFHDVLTTGQYTCYLHPDTRLPMIFLDDVIRATVDFLEADNSRLTLQTYNVTSMSFTPEELATELCKYVPNMEIIYKPDERQAIADQWPQVFDDTTARRDWGWNPRYDLAATCKEMVNALLPKYRKFGVNVNSTVTEG